jgi:hypothetical protein
MPHDVVVFLALLLTTCHAGLIAPGKSHTCATVEAAKGGKKSVKVR